jgi:anthranilate synthase/aminodeoxychorismate synthase-like glutamine amidotransferase
MLLLIDNYDSFTYNLYQYLAELGADVLVRRNDALTLAEIERLAPERIVISPGPGAPAGAGISLSVVRELGPHLPLLGVCLGHQCIGEAFGGHVVRAPELRHGKASAVHHDGRGVLAGLPDPFQAIRYHSLVVDRPTLPDCLEVSAQTEDGLIMGLRHRELPIEGVQFHPESVLTEAGHRLLANFLGVELDADRFPNAVATSALRDAVSAAARAPDGAAAPAAAHVTAGLSRG